MVQEAINDIWICRDEVCAGQCNNRIGLCEHMMIGAASVTGLSADVVYTADGGNTWTNAAAQPFGADEDIVSVGCFQLDGNTTRWVAVRGIETGTPANPAEIAYSDDTGATWTNVDVESGGTRYAVRGGALFVLDPKHIWLVITGGYIFFSGDGGLTWTNQDDGQVTAEDYNAVEFASKDYGFAVADNGIVVRSIDGGDTWNAATAITGTPNILCLHVFDKDNLVVGDDVGSLWRSWDGGTTWTEIFTGGTSIEDVDYFGLYVGFMLDNDTIYRTRNGGEDWETVGGVPTVDNFNAIVACSENLAYAVGQAAGGEGNEGFVVQIGPNPTS